MEGTTPPPPPSLEQGEDRPGNSVTSSVSSSLMEASARLRPTETKFTSPTGGAPILLNLRDECAVSAQWPSVKESRPDDSLSASRFRAFVAASPHSSILHQLLPTVERTKPEEASPSSSSSTEAGPGDDASDLLKVSVLQNGPRRGDWAAKFLDEFLSEQEVREGRKADFVILPENWLTVRGTVELESNDELRAISQIIKKHAVHARSMMEIEGTSVYVTSVFLGPDGSIIGSYRKRKPVHEGAHAVGKQVGLFDTAHGKTAIMICFDIENEDIFLETVAGSPFILFNPTWIPTPATIKSATDNASVNAWRLGLESMSHKFEQLCIEHMMYIIRCDEPYPIASGTSQIIGPYSTIHAPHMTEASISVFIERDKAKMANARKRFSSMFVPAERERTLKKDQTGNRYAMRSFAGHRGPVMEVTFVDPMMKLASASADKMVRVWNGNTLECLAKFAHGDVATSVIASKTNRAHLWSSSLDGTLRCWDMNTGKSQHVVSYALNADDVSAALPWKIRHDGGSGETIFCACTDGVVRVYDVRTSNIATSFGSKGELPISCFSAIDANHVSYGYGNTIQVWDVRNTAEPVHTLNGHDRQVSCLQIIEGASLLASGSYDGTIRIWDLANNERPIRKILRTVHNGSAVTGLAVLNQSKLISTSANGTVGFFDWQRNRVAGQVEAGQGESDDVEEELGVCLHRIWMTPAAASGDGALFGIAFEGKQKVAVWGAEDHWRMLKFTQDMNVLDLKNKMV